MSTSLWQLFALVLIPLNVTAFVIWVAPRGLRVVVAMRRDSRLARASRSAITRAVNSAVPGPTTIAATRRAKRAAAFGASFLSPRAWLDVVRGSAFSRALGDVFRSGAAQLGAAEPVATTRVPAAETIGEMERIERHTAVPEAPAQPEVHSSPVPPSVSSRGEARLEQDLERFRKKLERAAVERVDTTSVGIEA